MHRAIDAAADVLVVCKPDSAALIAGITDATVRSFNETLLPVASFAAAVVHGEVLGVGVERQVRFDHPLVVHSPMIVDCPDRTLARDDDQRPTA